jgi:cyclin H
MWIASKLSGDSLDNILGVVSEIALMITTDGQPPDTEVVRLIDRKVRICTNPARIPGTKAYIARQEEEEQKEQEKRERKAQEIKQVMQNNDPFEDDSVDPPRTMMLDDDD